MMAIGGAAVQTNLCSTRNAVCVCIAHSEPDGTRRRTGGEVKGKDANGVGSQQPCTVCWKSVTTNNKNM